MKPIKRHIPSLNGLRALSIFMVVGYHFQIHHFFYNNKFLNYIGMLLFNGGLGVNIFFVISGFLITTLLITEQNTYGFISLKKFYLRRTIRIFPAYYFLLLVYFILNILGYLHFSKTDWLIDATYTRQFFPGSNYFTSHFWSLSVEELFYLIWPLIFIKGGKYTIKIIFVFIILITISRFTNYNYPIPKYSNSIFSVGDALLIGCLFAIKYDKILSYVISLKSCFILYFFLLFFFIISYNYLFHLQFSSKINSNQEFWVNRILSPICYALLGSIGVFTNLIVGLIVIYSINIKGLWFKFLNFPLMEFIGKLSYSFYLWQQLFTSEITFFHKISLLILITLIFLCACFSYNVIEKPALKLKRQFETVKY